MYSNSAAVSLLMLLTPYDSPDAPPGIYIERERTRNRGAKKKKDIEECQMVVLCNCNELRA